MDKEKKKTITPDINEEMMMNLMVDGVKKEGMQLPPEAAPTVTKKVEEPKGQTSEKPVAKEKSRTRRVVEIDYESTFLRKTDSNARDGKTVYIKPEFHEKLTRIIQVIGEDKISIYAYLNNLLEYHFQEFGEQITRSYNEKYKSI